MSIRLGEAHYRFTIDDEGLAVGLKRAQSRVKAGAAAMAGDIGKLSSSFDAVGQRAELAARRADSAMARVRSAQRNRGSAAAGTPSASGIGALGDTGKLEGMLGVVKSLSEAFGGLGGSMGPAVAALPELTAALGKAGPAGAVAAVAITAFMAALDQAGKAMVFADEVHDTAKRLHITTDALQAYRFALKLAGGEEKGADEALAAFSETLGKAKMGVDDGLEAFKALGFTSDQINGFRDADEALDAVRDKLGKLSDAQRDAVISQFGLSGMKDLLQQSAEEQDRMIAKALEMGAVMDEELIERGNALNDEFEALQKVIDVQLKSAFVDLGPILVGLLQMVAGMATFAADAADSLRSIPDKTERGLIKTIQGHEAQIERIKKGAAAQKGWRVDEYGNVVDKEGRNRNDDLPVFTKKILANHEDKLSKATFELAKRRQAAKSKEVPQPPADKSGANKGGGYVRDDTDSADDLARNAESQAQRSRRQTELSMATDPSERARIQREMLEDEQAMAAVTHDDLVKQVTSSNSRNKDDELLTLTKAKEAKDADFAARMRKINADEQIAQEERSLEISRERTQSQIEVLESQLRLDNDEKQTAAIKTQILILQKDLADKERTFINNRKQILADAAVPGTIVVNDPAEQKAADEAFENDREAARYKGPLERYFQQIKDINTASEEAAVEGLETFNKGLLDIAVNGGKGIDVLRASLLRFLSSIANNSLLTLEKAGFDWLKGIFNIGGSGGASGGSGGGIPSVTLPGRMGTPPFLPAPHYASGTDFHPGGLAMVGEMGPELVDLPRGARVFTAAETRNMTGAQAPVIHQTIHLNAQGAVLADTIIAEARAHAVQVGVAAVQGGDRMNRFNRAREGRRALL